MASNQNSGSIADKLTAIKAVHAEYNRQKEELFAAVLKATNGRMNTLDIASATKWLAFVQDNPKAVTNTKYNASDFAFKTEIHTVLADIEAIESQDQGHSKALRDIVSSDLRFYWTTAEDFYIEAAEEDSVIKEKYKDLPSISPKRKSANQITKDFQKLEVRLNKKKDDSVDLKAA